MLAWTKHFSLVELTLSKKVLKCIILWETQVKLQHIIYSRHIRKKKKEALKSLRKVTLKIEPKVSFKQQQRAAAQRCYSPAAVFALLSCSRRSSSLSFALVPPNHPSKIGLPVVACLLLATDRPSAAWKVKGASQPKLCFIELRENDKKGVRGIWFSASGYTVY